MPATSYYSPTAAKGSVNIVLEALGSPGEQLLLPTTPVVASITGTFNSMVGSTGNRLHIIITNWDATGTITITGVGSPANTEVYTVPAPTVQPTQSPQVASFEVVTVNAYTSITSIASTGVTSGLITVYGIQAGKYSLPSVMKSKTKPKTYSPNEHSGLMARNKKIVQLTSDTTIDEIKQDVYANLSLWWPYMMMGAPTTVATIPATPSPVVASASITGVTTTLTIATQPLAPGEKLIFNVTAFTTAGTMTIVGTSGGVAGVTEVVAITGVGSFYSSNAYSAITTITNATTVATMSVTGVFGWSLTFLDSGVKYSAAIEWYDGVGSWTHPFSLAMDGSYDIKVNTEATITVKGVAQDKLAIGDRTTSPLNNVNRIASLGLNLDDMPLVGWQSKAYVDPISGTSGTTAYEEIQEFKIDLKCPDEAHWTFTNSQNFNRAYTGKREGAVDTTLNFINLAQYEQFRQNLKQYLAFVQQGQYIGTTGGVNYYKSWAWTLPIRSAGDFEITSDPGKAIVTAKAGWTCEYDSNLASSYRLVVITTTPPTYAA